MPDTKNSIVVIKENSPTLLMRQELARCGISCQGFAPGEIRHRYQIMLSEKITGRCHICGGNGFWETPDGRLLCARCHPKPR